MYLLTYITSYKTINALYDPKEEVDKRLKGLSFVPLPFPVYALNSNISWDQIELEIKNSLGLKSSDSVKRLISVDSASYWGKLASKFKENKIVETAAAFKSSNIPLIYIGEEKAYSIEGPFNFSLNQSQICKWFEFDETLANVENFLVNRKLYGEKPSTCSWERALNEAIAREQINIVLRGLGSNFLSNVEEFYISVESLSSYNNYSDLLLTTLDSIDIMGYWTIYYDHNSIVPVLSPLFIEAKKNVLEFLSSYPFVRMSHVFITPRVKLARITFKGEKEQILSLEEDGISVIPPIKNEEIKVSINVGKKVFERSLVPTELGIVFDTRKRPREIPDSKKARLQARDSLRKQLSGWGGKI